MLLTAREKVVLRNERKPSEASLHKEKVMEKNKVTRVFFSKQLARMHFFAFLLLMLTLQLSAKTNAQISLHVNNASLESVLQSIKKQTGLAVVYQDQVMQKSRPVTISVRNESVEKVLSQVFKNQDLMWELVGAKIISIKEKNKPAELDALPSAPTENKITRVAPITVKGRVIDASTGEPLANASVMVKGAQIGVRSSDKGEFIITLESGSVLEISMVGYQTTEERVNASTDNLIVRLKLQPKEMEEVIAVGYFNRNRSTYTGAASTYTAEDIRKVGNANVFQALKNLMPSLIIDNLSLGSNPNALPNIQLRGTSTFEEILVGGGAVEGMRGNYIKSPNEPLFILDGFEASLERIFDMDINRIESITILKDAASKAIYGAKAANGVVVVETKKRAGNRMLIHYNGALDIEVPDLTSYNLTNAREKLEAELLDGFYQPRFMDVNQELVFQELYNRRKKRVLEGLNTDWIAKPLREGIGHKHTIGIELGNEGLNVLADFNYRDIQGVMKGSNRKTIGGNVTTSYRVSNFLFRNIMTVNSNSNEESPYGSFNEYAKMNPYWVAENPDGTIPFFAEQAVYTRGAVVNPYYNGANTNTRNSASYFNFTNNFYVEWIASNQFRLTGRFGLDHKTNESHNFLPPNHTNFYVGYYGDEGQLRKGTYFYTSGKGSYISGDLVGSYRNVWGKSVIGANAGLNISERKFSEVGHKIEGFASDRMKDITFGRGYALNSRPGGLIGINRDLGAFLSANYSYDERFLLDFSFRGSASSQFGADKRWGLFYSVGLGYNLHNEAFIEKALPFVDELRLRASLGTSGNPNFATNVSIATYNYYSQAMYQGFPGTYINNLSNPNLKWESILDYNLGLDFRISKLSGRIDYYDRYTENLVTPITVVPSTGFNIVYENLGKIQNKGVDINLSYNVYQKGRNFINLYGSLETNINKILALSDAMKAYNDRMTDSASFKGNNVPVKRYQEGGSLHTIWAVPSLGIDPATGMEIYLNPDGSTTYLWDGNNLVNAGYGRPTYQGTFGANVEFNGWGLNFTARYLGGGEMYNQTLLDRVENVDMAYNVDKRVLNGRWKNPGDQTLFKRLGEFSYDPDGDGVYTSLQEVTRATTRFVQERRELDLGAINVYYLVPDKLVKKWNMQRLKLSFNMNEIGKFSTIQIERGLNYPFARTLSFSISATF